MAIAFAVALVVFAVVAMVRRIRQSVAARVAVKPSKRHAKQRPARTVKRRGGVPRASRQALAAAYVAEWKRYTRRAARIAALLKNP